MNNSLSYTVSPDGRELYLPLPEPFSFTQNVSYLARAAGECMHRVVDGRIRKAIPVDGETEGDSSLSVVVEVFEEQPGRLSVRFLAPEEPPSELVRDAVALYTREWFDLDTDLAPFYHMASKDPLLELPIRTHHGLRTIGIPDLFEALCWGIIGQQINLPFAYTLKRRFVERYGRSLEYNGECYWLFPSPKDIAALPVEELTELKMTTKKSEYLIGVAGLVSSGQLTKEKLLGAGDLKQAEKMLVSIRGIGPWTANYVLMRCLRTPSAFPIDDVGLHNAIKHVLGIDRKPTKEEIVKLSANWTGWQSYATFYLWRLLY
ncbi:DNA-3-methyladenine glycosylase family protein [Paenibacillus radicis (ex Gao et al. 2016)]|uniref:DNA-3-methyladenine glycosylase II n=1 Tax=Paenibacillus radicis (ex Gao et al. 2016) TaxID=1737354 RepID=A0A917HH87_9BACL|nr:DNA-3-methyladenine glycosylase [Paenibacillus radicis (ex Gao et al. 2016)]GGG79092.1 DNA-3-methyladenine glycosylase [Paenibacillus radicis (ex Gao et al. 2016)]